MRTRKDLESLLGRDFSEHPYEPESEDEAYRLADLGIREGVVDERDVLRSNVIVKEFLNEKIRQSITLQEKEDYLKKDIILRRQREKEKVKEDAKLEKELAELQKLSGLKNPRILEKLKTGLDNLEYKKSLKKFMDLGDVDMAKEKEKVKRLVESLKEEEETENYWNSPEGRREEEQLTAWAKEEFKNFKKSSSEQPSELASATRPVPSHSDLDKSQVSSPLPQE